MGKGFQDIYVPYECSPKDDLRKILIIKCIGWLILRIPVSLFPQPLVNGPMNRMAMVAVQQHWLPVTNANRGQYWVFGVLFPGVISCLPNDTDLLHWATSMLSNSRQRRGLLFWSEFLVLIIKGKIGLPVHSGSKEEYFWNTGDPLWYIPLYNLKNFWFLKHLAPRR